MKKTYNLTFIICMVFIITSCGNPRGKVVGEYDASKLGNDFSGSTNIDAFAMGVNEKGMPIFKNQSKAFKQVKIDCKDGFTAIQEEFDLKAINKRNWESYMVYGWQISTGNQDIQNQGWIISQFFDIYENRYR